MDKKKTIYQLDTPFSSAAWPDIKTEDQDAILELLCSLLAPLGNYRRKHVQPSKGKGSRKRRREHQKTDGDPAAIDQTPPVPGISQYVVVGLSNITRTLQGLASSTNPLKDDPTSPKATIGQMVGLSAIFVARSGQSRAFQSHFPHMVAVASQSPACNHPIRLVGFSKQVADRLSTSLGIPRVSAIGLYNDAPNNRALTDFVAAHVAPIVVPWLQASENLHPEFLGTKIKAVETIRGGSKTSMLKT